MSKKDAENNSVNSILGEKEFSERKDFTENLLSKLISFNTTNGTHNEKDCIHFIKKLLEEKLGNKIQCSIYALDQERPVLYSKIKSKNPSLSPLLIYGHVDVVGVENQEWSVDPFAGTIKEGYVWGRGALDMKGPMAMYISALIQLKNIELPYDIIFCALPDEEGEGIYGAKFMVEEHPELFEGVKYALGEFGGFSIPIGGKTLFPIMIAEKQCGIIKLTARGEGGHGSFSHKNTAITKLAKAIGKLNDNNLPIIITDPTRFMISDIAKAVGGIQGFMLKKLLNPSLAPIVLKLGGENLNLFKPLIQNTINPTILEKRGAINVIPSIAEAFCDLRILPTTKFEEAVSQIKAIVGDEIEVSLEGADINQGTIDLSMFEELSQALQREEPKGIPVSYVLSGVTDGRFFSKLNIMTYGFTPLLLPGDFSFTDSIHGKDEKVPVAALDFGVKVLSGFLGNRKK